MSVRLINSDKDAAVKLSIDGLSCFAFSDVRHVDAQTRAAKYSVWIVLPRATWWFAAGIRSTVVRTFKVGSYETRRHLEPHLRHRFTPCGRLGRQ